MKEKNLSDFTGIMLILLALCPVFATATVHRDTLHINQPNPLIADGGDSVIICPGTGDTLHASGGLTYSWSPSTGLSCTACQSPYANPTADTKYTVTVTGQYGCTATDTVWIRIRSTVTANAGRDASVCKGDSIQLHAGGGSIYTWTPSTGLSNPTISNPKASPEVTTTYTVVVSSGGACGSDSDKVIITVKKKPEVPTITKLNDSTLHSSASTNNHWYLNGSPTGVTSQNDTVRQIGSYTVVVDSNGCSSTSSPFPITIGVRDQEVNSKSSFALFPNPNKGTFTVVFDANEIADYNVELRDVLGRLIHQEHLEKFIGHYSQMLDLSSYPKGFYSLSLRSGKEMLAKKVVTY